jgi:PAS domain S-box-containing protein
MTAPSLGRVLIVDDEAGLMTALCEMLTEQGYESVGTTSAREALALLQEQEVDLLVSDLMMPEMDGIALLREALDIDQHLVGIIMTGQGTIQTAVDAMKLGAFDYVLKPFKRQTLLPTLKRAMQVRQLRMENVQLRETVAIYELGQAIACTLDVNTLLHNIIDGAMQQVNGTEATIMLPTPDGLELLVAAAAGKNRAGLLGNRIPRTHSVLSQVVHTCEPLTWPGTVSDLHFASQPPCANTATIVLPMLAGGKLVGVLSVSARQRHRPFTLGQAKALSILANLAATALENAALYTQVYQSEERFRSVTESATDAILSTDSSGTILSWNCGAQTLFGYTQDEIVGRALTTLMPERYHNICADMSSAAATGQQSPRGKMVEVHGLRRDGSEVPVELSLSSWRTDQGAFFSAIIRDITERTRLETQLRQAQKMQAIGTLAGGIAHDFNNMLAAIMGYTELALLDIERDSTVWTELQRVLTAGHRAKGLIGQILAFSRQTTVERTPLECHLLVKDALTLLRGALPSTIEMHQVMEPNTGFILADPTQIHQVLINLCTNAAHAMQDTGGVIEVHLAPFEVTADDTALVPALQPGPYVRLVIRDTGHGMTPETMERIFEPFFTTKKKGEGTGMGLAVVHGIVTSHGGVITVESVLGQGTTFAVYLPRMVRTMASPIPEEEPLPKGKERILFIDDEEPLARLGHAMLERLGYDVVVCTSSPEALNTFRATPQGFDLVITDHTMPTMTGEVLAREVRSIRADIPIILCTGFSRTMTAERARTLGIDAFVLKPMMIHDLSKVIRQVLGHDTA